ncbi:MAG: formate dehydrogenase accessory sulfurtransferase FdhD [Ferrimicrobium sp.]|jgi:FdhD protein|nr:formate dehydrogenase accessory sulfurtransferase FdhD [Ferrimicrobium sp.]
MRGVSAGRSVTKMTLGQAALRRPDMLAIEEPLELRFNGRPMAVTMRTPGDDFDLAAGFLVSEGVVTHFEQLISMRYCAGVGADGVNRYNVLDLVLAKGVEVPEAARRSWTTTSSCGLCGKSSIDAIVSRSPYEVRHDSLVVDPARLVTLSDRLRSAQQVFDKTGGLHGAALFDGLTGELLVCREDVGRHNAVDKVIGWAFRERRLPLRGTILMVSGRTSFELVQKALMAGIPVLSAVSAPSSLAVDLAVEAGMTLVGFLRGPSFVVYAGAERVGDALCATRPTGR